MSTLLAVTVGGSCAPVITAIQRYKPDYVCFLVSSGPRGSHRCVDGPGNPCGDPRSYTCPECKTVIPLGNPKGENIQKQTQLIEEKYEMVELTQPDDFADCYDVTYRALKSLAEAHEGWRLVADYTGGTKTMTAVLAATALNLGWELSLVKASRDGLAAVHDGTQIAFVVNAADVRARQQMEEVRHLFDAYAYASAAEILDSILCQAPLSGAMQQEIQARVTLCRAFMAWDYFDHSYARSLLTPYQSRCVSQWKFLKTLTTSDPGYPLAYDLLRSAEFEPSDDTKWSKKVAQAAYALVLDLLRSAERRASRGRYDDAVARLYRALELLAQIKMLVRESRLDSSDLAVEHLPDALQAEYEALRDPNNKKVKLGLRQDYELLAALNDPLGVLYKKRAKYLLNVLEHRNASILAHGLKPVRKDQWDGMWQVVHKFIDEGLKKLEVRIDAPQFPSWDDCTFQRKNA